MHNAKKCGTVSKIAWILVVLGALNWGLVGIGEFFGANLNVVNLILGSVPSIENIVYVLIGLSALASLHGCKKCKGGTCEPTDAGTAGPQV